MVKKTRSSHEKTRAAPGKQAKSLPSASPTGEREVLPISDTFRMTKVEQLKCISVPVRLRILESLAEKPMTTKQVALQLGESVTGLYRHVEALAQVGLVILVSEVPKRGTVQKFYRSAAKRFVADESCLPRVGSSDPRLETILELIEATRRGVVALDPTQTDEPLVATAASTLVEVNPQEHASLIEAITDAIQAWCSKRKATTAKIRSRSSRISIFVHPENLTKKRR